MRKMFVICAMLVAVFLSGSAYAETKEEQIARLEAELAALKAAQAAETPIVEETVEEVYEVVISEDAEEEFSLPEPEADHKIEMHLVESFANTELGQVFFKMYHGFAESSLFPSKKGQEFLAHPSHVTEGEHGIDMNGHGMRDLNWQSFKGPYYIADGVVVASETNHKVYALSRDKNGKVRKDKNGNPIWFKTTAWFNIILDCRPDEGLESGLPEDIDLVVNRGVNNVDAILVHENATLEELKDKMVRVSNASGVGNVRERFVPQHRGYLNESRTGVRWKEMDHGATPLEKRKYGDPSFFYYRKVRPGELVDVRKIHVEGLERGMYFSYSECFGGPGKGVDSTTVGVKPRWVDYNSALAQARKAAGMTKKAEPAKKVTSSTPVKKTTAKKVTAKKK